MRMIKVQKTAYWKKLTDININVNVDIFEKKKHIATRERKESEKGIQNLKDPFL